MPDPIRELSTLFEQLGTRRFWGDVLAMSGLILLLASAGPLSERPKAARAGARLGTVLAVLGLALDDVVRQTAPRGRLPRGRARVREGSAAPTIAKPSAGAGVPTCTSADARRQMMTDLAMRQCVPCQGGTPALGRDEIQRLMPQIGGWEAISDHHLSRNFDFPDFAQALAFVNRVGELAEREGHHPDICLTWGKVGIELWTHKVDGLTESDFILAAKINRLA